MTDDRMTRAERVESAPSPEAPEERESQPSEDQGRETEGVSRDDFHAYMPMAKFIFAPSRDLWPASSVDARVPAVPLVDRFGNPILDKDGNQKHMRAR